LTPERLADVERVFDEARRQPAVERRAFLAKVGESDPELAGEVTSLLGELPSILLDRSMATLVAGLLPVDEPRLRPGQHVGHYVIGELIGTGSMGEVYQAQDTSLGREVAIKLLPTELREDPERLVRFEREARLLATLNHPHVATIHGMVDANGVRGLVLELIDGPTLADRLTAGALPVHDALTLARQIAEALDAIHGHGVVHRDLKPANIKLPARDFVKIIDFGIGKSMTAAAVTAPVPPKAGDTNSGVILGTPAYMSPEQASGASVDRRADIWAFGCVVFEMLCGARAFPGEDAPDALARVLGSDPDWQRLPADTPPAIRRVLRRCLEKNPGRRLRDIGDARLEIDEALDPAAADDARRRPERRTSRAVVVVGVVSGALAGILATALLVPRRAMVEPPAVQRFSLRVPAATQQGGFALSPDGTTLVYETQRQLYLQSLADPQPRLLAGTENAVDPFFSPDGRWLAFVSAPLGQGFVAQRGQLRKVSIQGGAPVTLADAVALGGSWGADDRIVFAREAGQGVGLFSVAASGGTPSALTVPTLPGARYARPQHLPDGRTIVFSQADTADFDSGRIAAWAPGWSEPRTIVDVGYGARYLPSGHLVYVLDGNLMAAPFNAAQVRLTSTPIRLITGIETESVDGGASLTVATTGLMLYAAASDASRRERSLVWVASDGQESDVLKDRAVYNYPRLSPDGRRLAVGLAADIAVVDLQRGTMGRIAAKDRGTNPTPPITAWTTDGRRLAFNRRSPPVVRLESVDPDDLEKSTLLVSRPYLLALGSWSPSGALAFFEIPGNTQRDLAILEPGNGEPTPWLGSRFNERGPMFAPSGRAIAYVSDASGRDQVYLRPYPGSGPSVQVSVDGGTEPAWSRDGRVLFFRDGARMLAAAVDSGHLSPGPPRVLFERAYASSVLGVANYDVASDRRFLMVAEPNAGNFTTLAVVEHWFEELKRLVPSD
jgi:Tol biopolymer transport system component